jgi:acyl dehydratase
MKFFEDIRVGETVEIGSHVFTAEDIKTFAQRFDPQPFHVDDEAAARSHFGRLCASGWHTACVWMRLLIDRRRREDDERRGARRGGRPARTFARLPRPAMAQAGLCRRYRVVWHRGDRDPAFEQPPGLGHDLHAQHRREPAW